MARSVAWYRVLYVACIVALSVQTMVAARGVSDHHFWLPVIEIVGALLLLLSRTQRAGLAILLVVYAVAGVVTIHSGHLPVYLLLYAGSAALLVQLERERSSADRGVSGPVMR